MIKIQAWKKIDTEEEPFKEEYGLQSIIPRGYLYAPDLMEGLEDDQGEYENEE